MQVGWDRGRRVRGNLIYITLQDGKVYIEYDGMERGISQNLIQKGISQNHLVLAFLPESQAALRAALNDKGDRSPFSLLKKTRFDLRAIIHA